MKSPVWYLSHTPWFSRTILPPENDPITTMGVHISGVFSESTCEPRLWFKTIPIPSWREGLMKWIALKLAWSASSLAHSFFSSSASSGGLYCPPPESDGLCSDTRTICRLSSDFAQTFFGWELCQIGISVWVKSEDCLNTSIYYMKNKCAEQESNTQHLVPFRWGTTTLATAP